MNIGRGTPAVTISNLFPRAWTYREGSEVPARPQMAALRRTTSDGTASHARKIGPALRLCEAVAILAYFPGEALSVELRLYSGRVSGM